jgi:hypothetical protein
MYYRDFTACQGLQKKGTLMKVARSNVLPMKYSLWTPDLCKNSHKQAGAELCQAQLKLG